MKLNISYTIKFKTLFEAESWIIDCIKDGWKLEHVLLYKEPKWWRRGKLVAMWSKNKTDEK